MQRITQHLQNSLGIFALLGIITLSALATMSLSPLGVSKDTTAQVAGAGNAEIVSGAIPLAFSDLHVVSPGYSTQLVRLTEKKYQYRASFTPGANAGNMESAFLKINNDNLVSQAVIITAQVPESIRADIGLKINDQQLFSQGATKQVPVRLEVKPEIETYTDVMFSFRRDIAFPVEVVFNLEVE